MRDLILIHSDDYARWVFEHGHPTQGRRFMLGRDIIVANAQAAGLDYAVREPKAIDMADALLRVHDAHYVNEVTMQGRSGEWDGQRFDLSALATQFVAGTHTAMNALLTEETLTAVHLPGAKHHAQVDRSSGFCVFADFASAARTATSLGFRVAILDIDVHHGDGTENLTRLVPNVMTFSVHESGIFPYTGDSDDEEHNVYNWPLGKNSTGAGLRQGVGTFLDLAEGFDPDMIFIAGGADGHVTDPLSTLRYEVEDFAYVGGWIRRVFPTMPVLIGGAGGYTPDGATPLMWSALTMGVVTG